MQNNTAGLAQCSHTSSLSPSPSELVEGKVVSVSLNATEDEDEDEEEDADTDVEDDAESELGCKVATRFCSIKLVLRDSTPRAGSRGVTNRHTKHSIYTKNRRR